MMVDLLDPDDAEENIIAALSSLAFVALLVWMFDLGIGMMQFAGLFIALLALGVVARNTGDLSVGFIIITIGIVLFIADVFLPSWFLAEFSPIAGAFEDLVGFAPSDVSPLSLLVLSIVLVPVMIMVRIRATGQYKKPDRVLDATIARLERYVKVYSISARLVILGAFTAAILILGQAGIMFGQIGSVVSEFPFIASNFVVSLAGYLSLGGELPYIGTLPLLGELTAPVTFGFFALVVLALAAMVKYDGSGPLKQFMLRR